MHWKELQKQLKLRHEKTSKEERQMICDRTEDKKNDNPTQ